MGREFTRVYEIELDVSDGPAEVRVARAGISLYRFMTRLDGRKSDYTIIDGVSGINPTLTVVVEASDADVYRKMERALDSRSRKVVSWRVTDASTL